MIRYFHNIDLSNDASGIREYSEEEIKRVWEDFGNGELQHDSDTDCFGYCWGGPSTTWYHNPYPDNIRLGADVVAWEIHRSILGEKLNLRESHTN